MPAKVSIDGKGWRMDDVFHRGFLTLDQRRTSKTP